VLYKLVLKHPNEVSAENKLESITKKSSLLSKSPKIYQNKIKYLFTNFKKKYNMTWS